MSIQLGIYDIFSRVIPGGVYLFAFVQLATAMGWVRFDWLMLKDGGIAPSFGLLFIAYIIGVAMERLSFAWYGIFQKPGMSKVVLEEFKKKHAKDWIIDFEDNDETTLRAYIRIHDPDLSVEIERNNALFGMLRALSFGFFLLAISEMVQLVITSNWLHIVAIVVLLIFSWQAIIQSKKQRRWFYEGVYETILAYQLRLEDRMKFVRTSAKSKNAK